MAFYVTRAIRASSLPIALAAAFAACEGPGGGGGGLGAPNPGPSQDEDGDGACKASCVFKVCGDDGCGGSCGTCGVGFACSSDFQCVVDDGTVAGPGEGGDSDATASPEPGTSDGGAVDAGGGIPDAGPPPEPEPDLPEEPLDPTDEDPDGDGILSTVDNCPTVFNPNQEDLDGDGEGNPCDVDKDNDKTVDEFDCEPLMKLVHPDATEKCGNGIDDDCDGTTDVPSIGTKPDGCVDYYFDGDGDGAGESSTLLCLCKANETNKVTVAGDCDDANPSLSPLVKEVCDGIDNNCNLLADEGCDDDGDGYCDSKMQVIGSPPACPNGGGDCLDYSTLVHPGAQEIDGDGLDNNCDGTKAGEGGGSLVKSNCPANCPGLGATVQSALCAMDICFDGLVVGANVFSPTGDNINGAWAAINHYGNTSNDLAPFQGGSYLVMGSGYEPGTNHEIGIELPGSGSKYDTFSGDGFQYYDSVQLDVTLKAPDGATGFSVDYIFFSAEYEEWIGSQYNDKFYIILKAPQTTGGQDKVINFTKCSNPGSYNDGTDASGQPFCYIAINTAFSEPCSNPSTDISGTGHECPTGSSTGWLTTTWPIKPAETFSLKFHIHDTSDEVWDSTVLIDNFTWLGEANVKGGTASHN